MSPRRRRTAKVKRRAFVTGFFASAVGGAQIVTGPASPQRGATSAEAEFRSVAIQTGRHAESVEKNVAALLADRIREGSSIPVKIQSEDAQSTLGVRELVILLGVPANHAGITAEFNARRIPPLTVLAPGEEGFLLTTVQRGSQLVLIAAGIDQRGVLYAAGEILRQMVIGENTIHFPANLNIRTAPAFEVRGSQFGHCSVALTRAKVRRWTEEELHHVVLDSALAGLNTVEVGIGPAQAGFNRWLKSYGLKTLVHYGPNVGSGPAAWRASESIGRTGYLCPSVHAAREALLRKCDESFRDSEPVDYVRFAGGDGGGCECDRCKPYGATFIRLCEDLSEIVHRYHPATQIFVTNQKLDNDDDKAIFAYLRAKPRPWLRAFCYGPGSDAMSWQPGHRQTHRMDLFRYPGFGPYDRYLKEILHELPPGQDIVFFNELTHWRYSQNGYSQAYPRADRNGDLPPHWNHFLYERRPDPALTMVYDRLSFFAWPRYYHWLFN